MTNRPGRHHLEIFDAWLHTATTQAQWDKLRKEIDSLEEKPSGLGFTSRDIFESDTGVHVPHLTMYVDVAAHAGDQVMLVNTVAHEAAHAAAMLLDHIGQQYDGQSEILCYLVGCFTGTLWKACKATETALNITAS